MRCLRLPERPASTRGDTSPWLPLSTPREPALSGCHALPGQCVACLGRPPLGLVSRPAHVRGLVALINRVNRTFRGVVTRLDCTCHDHQVNSELCKLLADASRDKGTARQQRHQAKYRRIPLRSIAQRGTFIRIHMAILVAFVDCWFPV